METETKLEAKSSLKNAIFYIIFFLLLIGSVAVTYVKIIINKNYQIVAETSCDPVNEQCFKWTCDVAIDGECSDVPEENTYIYKLVNKKASSVVACEASAEKLGCDEELSCTKGEQDCSYTYCDEANLSDGVKCVSDEERAEIIRISSDSYITPTSTDILDDSSVEK